MAALIDKGPQGTITRKAGKQLVLSLGDDLRDAKEEIFVRMVCDGLALGVAFVRAGFKIHRRDAPSLLWQLPRIKARAEAILEARRTSGVVTLGEVTDMLQRVFAGAHSEGEYSAAHNAAFSLARLYGHVTDKSTLEVIRRPSRDPDAPSEMALGAWVEALPALAGPALEARGEASFLGPREASFARVDGAPAAPLGLNPVSNLEAQAQSPNEINDLAGLEASGPYSDTAGPGPSGPEKLNDINGLDWIGTGVGVAGRSENGAPSRPVTGTPISGARTTLLAVKPVRGPGPTPTKKKRVPLKRRRVPAQTGRSPAKPDGAPVQKRGKTKIPSAKELFG